MTTTPIPSPAEPFALTLEGVRAATAAECALKGPLGVMARAILRLLEMLIVLFGEFKAGRLAVAEASDAIGAASPVADLDEPLRRCDDIATAPRYRARGTSGHRAPTPALPRESGRGGVRHGRSGDLPPTPALPRESGRGGVQHGRSGDLPPTLALPREGGGKVRFADNLRDGAIFKNRVFATGSSCGQNVTI